MASRVLKTDGQLTQKACRAISWSIEYVAVHELEHAIQSPLNQLMLIYVHACFEIEGQNGTLDDQEQHKLMEALITNHMLAAPLRQYCLPYEQQAMWSAWKARGAPGDLISGLAEQQGLDAPFKDRRR